MVLDYKLWNSFQGKNIPSSLNLYPIIYDYLKPEQKIIDIGCGYGKTCYELLMKGYHDITGIDINETGIEYAKNMQDELKTKCQFLVSDATNLSPPDETFDFGIMQAFLTAIPKRKDQLKTLKEANRVIKTKGFLYLAVFTQTWHNPIYRNRYQKGMELGYEKGSFPVYNKENGNLEYVAHHYTDEELVKMICAVGFLVEHFEYHTFTTRSGNNVIGMVCIVRKI